ncbi:MAG TPA: sugar ABC transporter ATP-binding protein [Clostridiaceae bacterium]|nr:sugar ABC transporter ATP-binding protein [Clostridiaceae bacterium]
MALLEMTNISKSFFGVPVLQNVNFSVEEGEVHALLGENGAGKSTLMNILAGVYTRDAGNVVFDGKKLTRATIKGSEDVGIAFVHQELNLFNDLRVFENIFLRKEITTRLGRLDKATMIRKSEALFTQLGVDIDPTMVVSELEAGKKQQLEIAKALFANAKLFILDEPTTALNNEEIEHLFESIRRLKKQGKAFIFISHKMTEIFAIADRYTVLRNGEYIDSGKIDKTVSPRDVARMMVGNRYSDLSVYQSRELGDVVIEADGLTGHNFRNVHFSVRKGEIVGFTGLLSAGISEIFQTIFGGLPIHGGTLTIKGQRVHNWSIHEAMRNRLAMIPSNRKENSLLPDASLLENEYVSEHTLSGRIQHIFAKRELSNYNALKDVLNIKANSAADLITSISGGNQQKVVLARWLNTESDILLMDNPTQGIDVGAKAEIYRLIHELARDGKTILVNSLEIPELQQVADRCLVFYQGQLQTELSRAELTEENVMLWATNAIHAAEVLSR